MTENKTEAVSLVEKILETKRRTLDAMITGSICASELGKTVSLKEIAANSGTPLWKVRILYTIKRTKYFMKGFF